MAFARRKCEEEARSESLRADQEAAAAVARAEAIDKELGLHLDYRTIDLPIEKSSKRVCQFIDSQFEALKPYENHHDCNLETKNPSACGFSVKDEKLCFVKELNPGAPPFNPNPTDCMEGFVQFLTRRELIANKIEKFDSSPENSNTWKEAFKNMIREVNISPSEELSLMAEHATGDSNRFTQRLRNAYIENPPAGVKECWRNLGEHFGSTAVVTQVHPDKLTAFPSLNVKDNRGLQELGDLLLELKCAKEDGGLTGLKILDEPAFLKPVLVKLPEDLQGRWQRHASRYKRQHEVEYPPNSEFASFIEEIARERNRPYLTIEDLGKKSSHSPKPPVKSNKISPAGQGLSAYKIEVSGTSNLYFSARDPDKWCVLHKLSHPIGKCRAFRAMSHTERKDLLNQYQICFRCLASTSHQAKDCTAVIKCAECQSDKHVAALHTDPPSEQETQTRESEDALQQGGEPAKATANCTLSVWKCSWGKILFKDLPSLRLQEWAP